MSDAESKLKRADKQQAPLSRTPTDTPPFSFNQTATMRQDKSLASHRFSVDRRLNATFKHPAANTSDQGFPLRHSAATDAGIGFVR
jgi:hypothetical protein